MRFTKIVCTLGPSSCTLEQIRSLVQAGMNVARINLSHGSMSQHLETIRMLKEINTELRRSPDPPTAVGILLDTKGAEVRTSDVTEKIPIEAGQEVVFSSHPLPKEKRTVVIVNHEHFTTDVQEAECILIDNGLLTFDIVSSEPNGSVVGKARQNGTIGSRRHVNLPGANLTLPSMTTKDWEDIAIASKEGIDFLALSFIREAKEVEEVRAFLLQKGAKIALISKIETRQAVHNIQEIIAASDGIMVARGDLGVEVPFETVPAIQDDVVRLSRQAGKPVIVATHMLESMIDQPMPTRAEVTDIAHAATSRTDATMLSGETASGEYPLEAVRAMDNVLRATEEHLLQSLLFDDVEISETERLARAHAAATLAVSTRAAALFVITKSGQTARDIARFRPPVPILAFTDTDATQRALQLVYGTTAVHVAFSRDPEETVRGAIEAGKQLSLLRSGDHIVLVSDALAGDLPVNTIQLRRIP